jgi:SAM-dependent methyltransferase
MPRPDWNERYAEGNVPWDTGRPDPHLVELVDSGRITPCAALEPGCGTGTNSLWLATRGFEVLGIDVSELAIARARDKRERVRGTVDFRLVDFLKGGDLSGSFGLVFDRGCFHSFDHAAERSRFAERVASVLTADGLWVSIVGSTEGPERESGPPRRSARDIADAVEPWLEVVELRASSLDADLPGTPTAWFLVARPRSVPAQPSTMRD